MRRSKNLNHFNFSSLIMIILIHTNLFLKCVRSEDFVVGDEEEWNSQANFLSWSQRYNFSAGDVLVFKYSKGQHNVFEVEETTYRSCVTSSGVLAKHETGNDRIELTEARKYWFLCDIEGHCLGGMRFGIDVTQFRRTSNSTIVSPSSQPSEEIPASPPPPTSSCDLLSKSGWGNGVLVVAFWLVFVQIALIL